MLVQDRKIFETHGWILGVKLTSLVSDKKMVALLRGPAQWEVHIWFKRPKHFQDIGEHTHIWRVPSDEQFGRYGWCFSINQEQYARDMYAYVCKVHTSIENDNITTSV
jgi:hypothetical protein